MTISNTLLMESGMEDMYKCVHCGLCLSACPTYLTTGREMESPRGRIALMKAVKENRIEPSSRVISHWESCLQCRGCETACPSGVPFGFLMEQTKAELIYPRKTSLKQRFLHFSVFKLLFPALPLLYVLGRLVKFYQKSGIQRILRSRIITKVAPSSLVALENQLPSIKGNFFSASTKIYATKEKKQGTVGLLSGCVMPIFQGPIMEATVRVLNRNGFDVVSPAGQGCCGALNIHAGERERASKMAINNIEVFLKANVDKILTVSAGCGSTMKEYQNLLYTSSSIPSEDVSTFVSMTQDITEFLVSIPLSVPKTALPMKVTYQDSCHLAHAQKITKAPREILQSIPGIELVELKDSLICCGAAGTYQVVQKDLSAKLLSKKMATIIETKADAVVTANPGCIIQIENGIKQNDLNSPVYHIVELLDLAYSTESKT